MKYIGILAVTLGAVMVPSLFLAGMAIQGNTRAATATDASVLSFDTIPLEDLQLRSGQFIILVDTTPARIETAHVALNVPCEIEGETATTPIAVVRGVAPNVSPATLEFVAPLSADEKHCVFHVTIPEAGEEITDIAMINTGDRKIEFNSGNFVTTSVTTTADEA